MADTVIMTEISSALKELRAGDTLSIRIPEGEHEDTVQRLRLMVAGVLGYSERDVVVVAVLRNSGEEEVVNG